VQVGPAHAGADDPNDRVSGFQNLRIGCVGDADVAGTVDVGGTHRSEFSSVGFSGMMVGQVCGVSRRVVGGAAGPVTAPTMPGPYRSYFAW